MEMGRSITIRKNKQSILPGIVGAMLGCIFAVFAFLNTESVTGILALRFTGYISVFDVVIFRIFLLVAAALFFGILAFVGIRRATSKGFLVVDERGIIECSEAMVLGFIPWCDAEFTGVRYVGRRAIMEVRLKHTAAYTDNRHCPGMGLMKIRKRKDGQIVLIDLSNTYWNDTGGIDLGNPRDIETIYKVFCGTKNLQ